MIQNTARNLVKSLEARHHNRVLHVNGRMETLGIALDAVTIVGAKTVNSQLKEKTIEIGLSIHREAGLKQYTNLTADEMAKEMITTIPEFGRIIKENNGRKKVVPLYEKGDEL